MSLERKIESSIFLCIPRDLNILGKSCTTFVIVKIVRNLSRGRSPCQRVNHVKSGVIYFFAFIFSYDTIHVSGTIHTWNRGLTRVRRVASSLASAALNFWVAKLDFMTASVKEACAYSRACLSSFSFFSRFVSSNSAR